MSVNRDQLTTNLSKAKRGYDKLYLDITVDVIQNLIADAVKRGSKIDVKHLDRTLGLVVLEREKHDG
tara:strand:- start:1414 stop:1614 length:201 start_codon:yes stop_codon:yes gene_type:complete